MFKIFTRVITLKCAGHSFDVTSDNFQLRNIMEAPLLQNMEDIEVGVYVVVVAWVMREYCHCNLI